MTHKEDQRDLLNYLEEKYVGFFPNIPKRPPIITKNVGVNINNIFMQQNLNVAKNLKSPEFIDFQELNSKHIVR